MKSLIQKPHLLRQSLLKLEPSQIQAAIQSLTDEQAKALMYDWRFWARPEQLPPPEPWAIWMLLAGRGYGKTRIEVEWTREKVEAGELGRLAIVARTAADVRDVLIEGESGFMAKCPPWAYPKWELSRSRLTWPNGAIATTYSADNPDTLRGPQHDGAICDELATWRYPEAWDNLMMGLRIGKHPQAVVATTPKPVKLLKDILALPDVKVTRGSTYENREYSPHTWG